MDRVGRRLVFAAVMASTISISILPAAADKCDDLRDPEPRIIACTQSITSGKWKGHNQAVNYNSRGIAYKNKGDYDRAIADHNEAIRLDPKYAQAYSNRGNAYRNKGDYDRAIADHNEAIRLDPKYATAFNNRGNAYEDKGDYDRAIADYNEAIRLDPKYTKAYHNRGIAYRDKGDYDRAIAAYNEAIRLDPKDSDVYQDRARAHLYAGDRAKALADIGQASDLDPEHAYAALWLDIIGQRNGLPSRLPQASAKLDMTIWPAPVVRLFLGQSTPAALLAAAADPDAKKKKEQMCEANFYAGEWMLRQDKAQAKRLLRAAADDCSLGIVESAAAKAELKANP